MSEISEDKEVKAFLAFIEDRASSVRRWMIDRSAYLQQHRGDKFSYEQQHPYPFSEDEERRVSEWGQHLFQDKNFEERQRLNGHLLWQYKAYLSQPFAPHIRKLIAQSVYEQPLDDKTKIQFLEFLFAANKHKNISDDPNFAPRLLCKLMDFDPHQNMPAVNRLFHKAAQYFEEGGHRKKSDTGLIFMLFDKFGQKVQSIEPSAVVCYAQLYFDGQRHANKPLDFNIITGLCSKTPWSRSMYWGGNEAPCLDKETMCQVFQKYVEVSLAGGGVDAKMNLQMTEAAKRIVDEHHYTLAEAIHLAETLVPPERDDNGKLIRDNKRRIALRTMSENIRSYAENSLQRQSYPLKNLDLQRLPEPLGVESIEEYTQWLIDNAQRHKDSSVSLKDLYSLLRASGKVDKQALNAVVEVYGQSVSYFAVKHDDYNHSLHDQMTKMLTHIAVTEDYSDEEMGRLKCSIAKGGDGHVVFDHLANVVENVRALDNDYHQPVVRPVPILKLKQEER